jgi:streptomycin 3"-adenylyltransferase
MVPIADYRASITVDWDWCHENLQRFTLHVVLSLPRIWATLATDDVHSKASAARWALPRLPADLRPVLEHALAVYCGRTDESWKGLPLDDYVAYVDGQIPT